MTDVLSSFGGAAAVGELVRKYYVRLAADPQFKDRKLDVEDLVKTQTELVVDKLGGKGDKTSIHTAHEKYEFSPKDIAYSTEVFLEVSIYYLIVLYVKPL